MDMARDGQRAEVTTVSGVCGICPGGCGVHTTLVDGRIERLRPIKGHPAGVVCARGAHAKEIVYSKDRLQHPLLRTGERGEGEFARIGWDEAMDRITDSFDRAKAAYGPEAVMTYFGRGSFDPTLIDVFGPRDVTIPGTFGPLFPYGSPNTASCSAVCYVAYGLLAAVPTIGRDMRLTYADFDKSDLVVVWGANPPTDSPPVKAGKIHAARKRGAKVVVIDHMRSAMAKTADQWIGVRSGTDGALALSMMHVIINEGLYDESFVRDWTVGFEELRQYVQAFPPEVGERITWVPRETITATARAIAGAKGAALVMYTGLEYTNSGVQNIRAALCLWAITGNMDVPGGLVFRPPSPSRFPRLDLDPPPAPEPIGTDRYPLFCEVTKSAHFMEAPRAILHDDPYPVRALMIFGGSVLTSLPKPEIWKQCFAKLDFLMTFDRFMTADALYADLVLPATTYFENRNYHRYPEGYCQLRPRIVEPRGEARSNYRFLADLTRRLGFGAMFPATEEDLVEFAFAGGPIHLADLEANPEGVEFDAGRQEYRKYAKGLMRPDGKPGFETPSGRIELVSSILEGHGHDGLPVYEEPHEGPLGSPDIYAEFPLVLNTGARLQSKFRSQHLNIPGLLAMQPKAQVLINPADARTRGIADGGEVWVASPRGEVGVWAKVTDDVLPGQVELNAGGGNPVQAEGWREANANYLTDFDNRDPISGFPVFKALLCEVRNRG